MKRTLSFLFLLLLIANQSTAQMVEIPDHSLGIRFGTVYGMGTEISYQHRMTSVNRLELNLGFNSYYEYANDFRYDYNSWGLTGLYHWVWNLDKNINWYAGPGARIGSYSSNLVYDASYNNGLFLSAAGDIGIEYCFPERIQLALDLRPELGLFNHGSGVSIGLAVRYQFK